MNRPIRRALLFAAVFTFLATTPVVILYALGYRATLSAVDPLPVGVLLIETEPAQAKVYIDGTYLGQSPRSLSRPTGAVTIKIEKEGYTAWQKNLTVDPGRATEARDVRLFPANRLHTTLGSNATSFSLSPSRRLIAVERANNTLTVLDQAGEVVVPPQPFLQQIEQYLWSPNSEALLIRASGAAPLWYLPIADDGRVAPLPQSLNQKRSPAWDPRIPGRILSLDANDTLNASTIDGVASVPLLPRVEQFATSASHLYATTVGGTELSKYSLQGQPSGAGVAVPTGTVKELLVTPQENIALLMESGDVWLLGANQTFEQVASAVSLVAWSPSGKVLLLQSDTSSLYVFNVNDKRTTLPLRELRLVQRLSRPIVEPRWFAGSRHIVYQVGDSIWISEIDTRDYPVTYEVDTTNLGSADAAVGEEGEVIFYLKKTGATTDLVATPLLAP